MKYQVHLPPQLKQKIQQSMHVVRTLYNHSVELCCKSNPPVTSNLKTLRSLLLNDNETNILSPEIKADFEKVPYDVRDEAIRDFLKAYKIQKQLVKEGKKKHFEMHYRRKRKEGSNQSIVLHNKHIKLRDNEVYCYPRIWGKEGLECRSEVIRGINHDSRLIWTRDNRYYLIVPTDVQIQPKEPTHKAVALDPGVKTFQTMYDTDGQCLMVGINDMEKLDKKMGIVSRLRDGLKRVWKGGRRILRGARQIRHNGKLLWRKEKWIWEGGENRVTRVTNKKKLKKLRGAADRMERKIRNKLSDIHRKTAKYLCQSYDTVIIPEFRSQRMSEKRDNDGRWKRRVGRETSRRMLRWGHYKFREILRAKGEITGTKVVVGSEEWSSKTCSSCLKIKYDLNGDRVYRCEGCGMEMNRDINGARNIMMMNWERAGLEMESRE